jgi:5'-nucleotidase
MSHGIHLCRAGFIGGRNQARYLKAYGSDLYLSTNGNDILQAARNGMAAAFLYPRVHVPEDCSEIRLAFDGDCVLFGPESEQANQKGLDNYRAFEKANEDVPLTAGPFKPFLAKVCRIQGLFPPEKCPIRTALVTSRGIPEHVRPFLSFRQWGINVDETHFLCGMSKLECLAAYAPHIFFDDQHKHCETASQLVTTGRVPGA